MQTCFSIRLMTWSDALHQLAHDRGMPEVTLHAQTHAAGFYRKFGFDARGDEFLEAGIPHVGMSLRLSRKA